MFLFSLRFLLETSITWYLVSLNLILLFFAHPDTDTDTDTNTDTDTDTGYWIEEGGANKLGWGKEVCLC